MHFCPFWCYFTGISVCVIMPINDVPRKTPWYDPMSVWTSFLYLGVYHWAQFTSIWESLPSQFVICRNLWSRPWRGILTPITRALCSWESTHVQFWHEYEKFHFCPFWCYFSGISVCIYISYKIHNRCRKETFLTWSDVDVNMFLRLGVYPLAQLTSIWKVVFWTVTNCDKSTIPTVAICDLSQFVIKAVTWNIDFDNTENVFWVFRRVPMFTFDMNMKSCIVANFGVISLV